MPSSKFSITIKPNPSLVLILTAKSITQISKVFRASDTFATIHQP